MHGQVINLELLGHNPAQFFCVGSTNNVPVEILVFSTVFANESVNFRCFIT